MTIWSLVLVAVIASLVGAGAAVAIVITMFGMTHERNCPDCAQRGSRHHTVA